MSLYHNATFPEKAGPSGASLNVSFEYRSMADKDQKIIQALKDHGANHGYTFWQAAVVIIGPGAPYTVYPTSFSQPELQKVIDDGKLEKRRLSGALNIDIYAIKAST